MSALFREAGVTRCDTLEELIDVAALFSGHPLTQGGRVAVLTNAGGLGILCADACDAAGLELPPLSEETRAALAAALPPEASLSNPVDMLGSASAELYERTLPLLLEDPGVDAVIVIFVPAASVTVEDVGAAIDRVRSVGESRRSRFSWGPDTRDPFRTRNPPPERSAGQPSEPSGSGSRSAPESSSTTSILGPAPSWSRVPSAKRTMSGSPPMRSAGFSRHTASPSFRSVTRPARSRRSSRQPSLATRSSSRPRRPARTKRSRAAWRSISPTPPRCDSRPSE